MEDNFYMDEFVWSFSRLDAYYTCPYSCKKKYVDCEKGENNFFGQYGTFNHKVFEKYFKNELFVFDLSNYYKNNYMKHVTYDAPYNKYADIGYNYYHSGLDYFDNFEEWDEYAIVSVEEIIKFKIENYDFVTIPDLIVRNKNNRLEIIDHKSEDLKEPKKLNTKVAEKLVQKTRQLYINSYAIYEQYEEYPEYLNFNVFRTKKWIKIPFNIQDFNEAIQWALNTINLYKKEQLWLPKSDYYFCRNLCNYRNMCEYKG
jgi:hypothetical protein